MSSLNSNFAQTEGKMYEASFQSILKTVLIILLIYFAFKIFIRYFGPIILKYFLKRIGNSFQQQFNQRTQPNTSKKSDVTIEKKPGDGLKSKKKVGEYIDYEEID